LLFITSFHKVPNTKFHANLSCGIRVISCKHTHTHTHIYIYIYKVRTDGQTDMIKLLVNFRNYHKVPKTLFSGNFQCKTSL